MAQCNIIMAINSIDIAMEIVSFISPKAMLPVALSCKRLYDGVKRYLHVNQLTLSTSPIHFVSSVSLVKWQTYMGCQSRNLLKYAAQGGHLEVLKWLRLENDPPCPWD